MHFIAAALSNAVDIFNSSTGAWTTAQLSEARQTLVATSCGHLAIFAGGYKSGKLQLMEKTRFE
jgi:hypothetical protein